MRLSSSVVGKHSNPTLSPPAPHHPRVHIPSYARPLLHALRHPGTPGMGDNAEKATKSAATEEEQRQRRSAEGNEETVQPLTNAKVAVKFPPFASSPKLESSEVVDSTVDSTFQQKRHRHVAALDEVACTGWDGAPLRRGQSSRDWAAGENEDDDYKAYYKGHKPSPLSEVKLVDTRKLVTRVTDGSPDDDVSDLGMGRMVEETVDEANV